MIISCCSISDYNDFLSKEPCIQSYLAFPNLPGVPPVFFFFIADPLTSEIFFSKCTFRLEDKDPVTVKKESSRPCVSYPVLWSRMLLHECLVNWFNYTIAGSLTLESMFSRISSIQPCCLIRSMALLGPIPLMVPQ
uniref:Uncharacterized protein n=1 Tax=Anabas testudineus TaxID=64144 RepID=A0A3Q1J0P1_ANATE